MISSLLEFGYSEFTSITKWILADPFSDGGELTINDLLGFHHYWNLVIDEVIFQDNSPKPSIETLLAWMQSEPIDNLTENFNSTSAYTLKLESHIMLYEVLSQDLESRLNEEFLEFRDAWNMFIKTCHLEMDSTKSIYFERSHTLPLLPNNYQLSLKD